MPAIDASIPLSVKVPDGMSSLGSFANTANAIRTYQTGQIEQQRQAVALQQEQGALDARNAVSQVVADPQYRLPDGTFDLNKIGPAIINADPKGYHADKAIAALNQYNNDTIKTKQNAAQLTDAGRITLGGIYGAIANDPSTTREKALDTLDTTQQQYPQYAPLIDIARKQVDRPEFDSPEKVKAWAMNQRALVYPLAAQLPQTTLVQSGAATIPVQGNQLYAPPGPIAGATQIPNQVGPGGREAVKQDAAGNPIVETTSPEGVKGVKPLPGAGTPPMVWFPPGESQQSAQVLQAERQAALQAVSQAPILHATNRGVLGEIDKVAATGTLGPRIQSILSSAGVTLPKGWGGASAEEQASAYDMIGKYLERNALTAAQAMGPHTNAGLESQLKAQGTVAYNPTAIKKITKLNDALVTGSEMYQPGLEAAINSSPNQIFAKRQFDAQWAQNFDVRTMQLYNAQKAGDTQEIEDIKKSLGPAGMADIQRKVKNLQLLATQGHL